MEPRDQQAALHALQQPPRAGGAALHKKVHRQALHRRRGRQGAARRDAFAEPAGPVMVRADALGHAVADEREPPRRHALVIERLRQRPPVAGVVPQGDLLAGDAFAQAAGEGASALVEVLAAERHVRQVLEPFADGGRLQDDVVSAGVDGPGGPADVGLEGGPGAQAVCVKVGEAYGHGLGPARAVVAGDEGVAFGPRVAGGGRHAAGVDDRQGALADLNDAGRFAALALGGLDDPPGEGRPRSRRHQRRGRVIRPQGLDGPRLEQAGPVGVGLRGPGDGDGRGAGRFQGVGLKAVGGGHADALVDHRADDGRRLLGAYVLVDAVAGEARQVGASVGQEDLGLVGVGRLDEGLADRQQPALADLHGFALLLGRWAHALTPTWTFRNRAGATP